jgi:hypothetical protein
MKKYYIPLNSVVKVSLRVIYIKSMVRIIMYFIIAPLGYFITNYESIEYARVY